MEDDLDRNQIKGFAQEAREGCCGWRRQCKTRRGKSGTQGRSSLRAGMGCVGSTVCEGIVRPERGEVGLVSSCKAKVRI